MDKYKNSPGMFSGAPNSFEDFMDLSPGLIPEASLNSADRVTLGVVNNLSIEQLRICMMALYQFTFWPNG